MLSLTKKHFILVKDDLIFVPYLREMIPTYHEWMADPQILYLTGSEPLTLEEEFNCQQDWLNDPKKYTFIILKMRTELDSALLPNMSIQEMGEYLLRIGTMVGDINLFLHDYLNQNEAEIDVMIGTKEFRQKGIAHCAVEVAMSFGMSQYQRDTFVAKIKIDNEPSINLFKKMGFVFQKEVTCFNEVHYTKSISDKIKYQSFVLFQ